MNITIKHRCTMNDTETLYAVEIWNAETQSWDWDGSTIHQTEAAAVTAADDAARSDCRGCDYYRVAPVRAREINGKF